MANPVMLVKLLVKEADSNESCLKCGSKGKGLSSFVFYIFYTDPSNGELMVTGWSFPLCQEHIPEEMARYPADKPVLTQKPLLDPLKDHSFFSKSPPPLNPRFDPHAD